MSTVEAMEIKASDLRIETFAKQAGGFVLIPSIAVRVTNIPTGIQVECDEHRSQHRNKFEALQKLKEILDSKRGIEMDNTENTAYAEPKETPLQPLYRRMCDAIAEIEAFQRQLAQCEADRLRLREALDSANQIVTCEGVQWYLLGIEERDEALK